MIFVLMVDLNFELRRGFVFNLFDYIFFLFVCSDLFYVNRIVIGNNFIINFNLVDMFLGSF